MSLQRQERVYLNRLEAFLKRIQKQRFKEQVAFSVRYAATREPLAFSERESLDFEPVVEGQQWGEAWDSAWFHLRAAVPSHWQGVLAAEIDINGEGLLFAARTAAV